MLQPLTVVQRPKHYLFTSCGHPWMWVPWRWHGQNLVVALQTDALLTTSLSLSAAAAAAAVFLRLRDSGSLLAALLLPPALPWPLLAAAAGELFLDGVGAFLDGVDAFFTAVAAAGLGSWEGFASCSHVAQTPESGTQASTLTLSQTTTGPVQLLPVSCTPAWALLAHLHHLRMNSAHIHTS